ncbi:hypothetical protein HMPREF9714_03308 [Myroides odoratimimus CCUG 12901]|uniref:hypothetical protein n=1 Tax=Myroides odoratimimus TaxID=76832 RepID=UPI0002460F52|nr:hypothetical protein [Myroides odoratimimus]EHO05370.1 hypothetical protein HMPREF9714_03308 [Myroides odoratimimus CCUG 12901]MDM1441887.1 hypothetical protein [Myroides odoratimimus]
MNTITFNLTEDLLIIILENMTKIKSRYKQDLAFITRELTKIEYSLKIECDKEVLEALKQTRHKWLIKLLHKREEIEKVNKILAILMLLNRESCK